MLDVLGTRRGFLADHAVVVGGLRAARPGDELRLPARRRAACSAWAKAEHFPRRPASWPSGFRSNSAPPRWASSTPAPRSAPCSLRRSSASILLISGWRMVFFAAGRVGLAWVAVVVRQLSRQQSRPPSPPLEARVSSPSELSFLDVVGMRQVQVPRLRQVHQRLGLVLLPLLAAEVSLRCARLRHQTRQLLCLDSLRRVRRRQLPRRLALQLPAPPRPLARLLAQVRPRPQRRVHAGRHAGPACAGRAGPSCSSASPFSASNPGRASS